MKYDHMKYEFTVTARNEQISPKSIGEVLATTSNRDIHIRLSVDRSLGTTRGFPLDTLAFTLIPTDPHYAFMKELNIGDVVELAFKRVSTDRHERSDIIDRTDR